MTTTIANTTLSIPAALAVEDRLGTSITWDAQAVACPYPLLERAVQEHCPQFLESLREYEVTPAATALTRAVARVHSGGRNDEKAHRFERVHTDDRGEIVFALAELHRRGTFSADEALRVTLDRSTGDVVPSRAAANESERDALQSLVTRFQIERGCLTAADLTSGNGWLRGVLGALRAVKLSSSQAHYLVPASQDGALEGVEKALAVAGVALIPIPVTSGASIRGAVVRSLADEARDLAQSANQRLIDVVEHGKKARPSSLEARLEEAAELRARANLYRALLGATTEAVEASLREVDAAVRSTMAALAQAAQ